MRGRKKKQNSYTEVVSIRVTAKQKDILKKNKWIKEAIIKQVREYLDIYTV